jgi:hypothetical protein
MPDYSQGKIYRLTCANLDLVYYGSTTMTLNRRLRNHRGKYNAWKSEKLTYSCASFELFEAGDVEIELVIYCPCDTKRELEEVEQTFIDNDECVNSQRAFQTQEERKEQKKKAIIKYELTDKRKEYLKGYYQTEKYKTQRKVYREKNKLKTIKTIE